VRERKRGIGVAGVGGLVAEIEGSVAGALWLGGLVLVGQRDVQYIVAFTARIGREAV
jgi:hypothetical protein